MKILLIGEFSSLHKFLKEGLLQIGHECTLASAGDGWKKIGGADIVLPNCNGNYLSRIYNAFRLVKIVRKFRDYDVVQFVHPTIFPNPFNRVFFDYIKKHNKIISLVAAGNNYNYYNIYKSGAFEYCPLDYAPKGMKYDVSTTKGRKLVNQQKYIVQNVDVIIPSLYEYSLGFPVEKTSSVIPFPINVDSIIYNDNIVNDKIVFFHGIIREGEKGTGIIREALEKLKAKYPDDVEVIIDGHMPYNVYLDVIKKTNVVVDQCRAYGYGINACISMAQGKIVVSGCRPETLEAFGIQDSPMICAKPDSNYLLAQFETILRNRSKLKEMGCESREYIERIHDYRKVASNYVKVWKTINN